MARPSKQDKLQVVGVTLDAATKDLLYQMASEAGVSVARYCAELIALGLTYKTGRSINELLEETKEHKNGAVSNT